jgi:hypothetical protein
MKRFFTIVLLIVGVNVFATDIISLYNNNTSLVQSELKLNLQKGIHNYYWDNVPETIDATSIIFNGKNFNVNLEKFENPSNSIFDILSNYIGEKIEITLRKNEKISGILSKVNIGNNSFMAITSESDRTTSLISYGDIVSYSLPKLIQNIPINPHMFFRIYSNKTQNISNKIFYTCSGIQWSAFSNAVIGSKNTLKFDTFAKIDNRSGKSFENAQIKLISGKVNRSYRRKDLPYRSLKMATADLASATEMAPFPNQEHSFENYHIYQITDPVNLSNNQVQIIPIIKKEKVRFTQKLRYYTNNSSVNKIIIIKNNLQDGLGISIPGGIVSFYKKDIDGKLISIGEDRCKNLAINSKAEFKIGDDFDVEAETTILDDKTIGKKHLRHYQVKLINGSEKKKEITVYHNSGRNSKIWDNSVRFTKKKSNLYTFKIILKPKKTAILTWQQSNRY